MATVDEVKKLLLVVALCAACDGVIPPPTVVVTFDTTPNRKCGGVYDGSHVWTASHCAKWWMTVDGINVSSSMERWEARDLARVLPIGQLPTGIVTIRCDVPVVAYTLGRKVTVTNATAEEVVLSGYTSVDGDSGYPVYDEYGAVFAIITAGSGSLTLGARLCP